MTMKVLFLQKRAHRAGAQVSLSLLVSALQDKGINAKVLMGEKGWLTNWLAERGALFGVANFPSLRSFTSKLFKLPFFASKIESLRREQGDFHILHANDTWEGLLTEWVAERWHLPWVVHIRNGNVTPEQFTKFHCHHAQAVIAVSPVIAKIVETTKPKMVQYIPNGISADMIKHPQNVNSIFPKKVGLIGTGDENKGWLDTALAFDIISKQQGRLPAEICFMGHATSSQQQKIRSIMPASIVIVFKGRIDDVDKQIKDMDLIIIPSRKESFGRVLLETIAAGIPVLASKTGIAPDILGEDSPWMFTPENPEDLARAWARLGTVWSKRQEALTVWQNTIKSEFMIENCAKKVIALYERVFHEFRHTREH